MREERRLRVFKNRVLRKIFGPKTNEVTGDRRNEEENEMTAACSVYGGRGEVYTGFWWGNLRERDHLQDPNVHVRLILRLIYRKWDVEAWIGSSWLRIGRGGGLL